MTVSPGIRVEQVTHCYGDALALDSIDLELPAGRLIGFIGPDGVGKSSLLGLVAGAKQLQSGRIEVLGGDIADAAHRRRVCPRIAFMPQGLGKNLYPSLTVRENLDFFAQLFGTPVDGRQARFERLLTATGLAEFVRTSLHGHCGSFDAWPGALTRASAAATYLLARLQGNRESAPRFGDVGAVGVLLHRRHCD